MTDEEHGSGFRSWLDDRFHEPWTQLSGARKAAFVLTAWGLLLGWFGDVVFWYENGYGFFDQAASAGEIQPGQPFLGLTTNVLVAAGVLAADPTKSSRMLAWVSGIFLAALGLGAGYLFLATDHPLALVPAILVLAGVVVQAIDRLSLGES